MALSYQTARVYSPNPFEVAFGYCRALRKGPFIFVSGTTAVGPDNKVWHAGNAFEQAKMAFQTGLNAIAELDAGVGDVTRVRMFVAALEDCERVGEAYRSVFETTPTAATMIVVGKGGFVNETMLVEVELDAVVSNLA